MLLLKFYYLKINTSSHPRKSNHARLNLYTSHYISQPAILQKSMLTVNEFMI